MKLIRKRGDTSNIFQVFIQDSSSTAGAGLTGLAFNSSGLTAYYHRDVDTTATAITLATMTVGTFTSSGFKEIDATNMPGWYQFCPPDAALAATSTPHSVGFHLKGATNMAPLPLEVQLVAVDVEDTVRFGLTALPNVASGSAGAIPTTGTGSNQITVTSGQVQIQAGTGSGQLDFTSGVVKANATQWVGGTIPAVNITGVPLVDVKYLLGTIFATPATAGIMDINVKNINNVAAATPGAAGGIFIAGTNAATTVTTSFTTTFTGSLTGSVASVTGNVAGSVASVTGNVGGNVVGSVGSVTGNTNQTGDAYALLNAAQAEPGQGAPAVNANVVTKVAYLFKAWRNKVTQTSTTYSLFADDASTVDQKATVSDDATTFTRGEVATGP